MKFFIFIIITLFLSSCVNDRGISARYYNDCKEYYDYQGKYHKECDDNIIDYSDVGNLFKSTPEDNKSIKVK